MTQSTQTPRKQLKARKCQFCGKRYKPKRKHQEYHDDPCRKAAFAQRQRERIRAEVIAEMGSRPVTIITGPQK